MLSGKCSSPVCGPRLARATLACLTPIDSLKKETSRITPLPPAGSAMRDFNLVLEVDDQLTDFWIVSMVQLVIPKLALA
jgi:hypothetical protein